MDTKVILKINNHLPSFGNYKVKNGAGGVLFKVQHTVATSIYTVVNTSGVFVCRIVYDSSAGSYYVYTSTSGGSPAMIYGRKNSIDIQFSPLGRLFSVGRTTLFKVPVGNFAGSCPHGIIHIESNFGKKYICVNDERIGTVARKINTVLRPKIIVNLFGNNGNVVLYGLVVLIVAKIEADK